MLKKLVSWIAVLSWMGFIFWLSSKSKVIPVINPLASYFISSLGHIIVYAVLYLLVHRAIHCSVGFTNKKTIWLSLLIMFLYGISDEYHQSFVPGRESSIMDLGFDLLGGMIAARFNENTRAQNH